MHSTLPHTQIIAEHIAHSAAICVLTQLGSACVLESKSTRRQRKPLSAGHSSAGHLALATLGCRGLFG